MPELPAPTSDDTQPDSPAEPVGDVARVRRAPRYRAFALAGVVLGLLAGALSAALVGAVPTASAIVLAAVGGGLLGALLGALVAVLLDGSPRRP